VRTGIFFYYQKGNRLRDFPNALEGILEREGIFFYDAFYPSKPTSSFDLNPVSYEALLRVHSSGMIEEVNRTGVFEGALLSTSGTVRAAEKIWRGEIDNAFVFTGYGDHHAGPDFFGGGCYFNGAAIAIQELRKGSGVRKFAIIDTDAHHGDGTWEIFRADPNVLYVCFCGYPFAEENNNVNVQVPVRLKDEEYIRFVKEGFLARVKAFCPEILFWNWGYDGTQGEYGDIGLTPEVHILLVRELKRIADEVSNGRFIIILCGGSRRDLARTLIPRMIEVLAEDKPPVGAGNFSICFTNNKL
jgi:acetoin utilization deacetylase AcuC-like enzyme